MRTLLLLIGILIVAAILFFTIKVTSSQYDFGAHSINQAPPATR